MHQPVLNGVPFGLNSRAGQTHEKKKDAYGLAKRKQRPKCYTQIREKPMLLTPARTVK